MEEKGVRIALESVPLMIALFAMTAAIGSSIVALINSITAKNNLNEVMENNRRALRPFLIIKSKEINLTFDSDEPRHLLDWDSDTLIFDDYSITSVSYIELANISNGIAKNVSMEIAIRNEETLIKGIANSTSNFILEITEDNQLYVTDENMEYGNDSYDVQPIYMNFIAVEKGGTYKIPLPSAFIILYNMLFLNSLGVKIDDMPYLEIVIEHEDIIGSKYKHEYIFSAHSYNVNTIGGEGSTVKAIFDIEEKKEDL